MKLKSLIIPAAIAAVSVAGGCSGKSDRETAPAPGFVTVRDGNFWLGDSVYRYVGTNFWYGAILGSEGRGGDRARLARELDSLKALGMDNLRILVGGDGPEGLASHISPTLQTAPGVYNDTLLRGLDYLLDQLEQRDMRAVLYLNNAWEWSGGFSAYLEWEPERPSTPPTPVIPPIWNMRRSLCATTRPRPLPPTISATSSPAPAPSTAVHTPSRPPSWHGR